MRPEVGELRIFPEGPEPLLPAAVGRDVRDVLALFPNLRPGPYTIRIEGNRWRSGQASIALEISQRVCDAVLVLRPKPTIAVELDVEPSLAKKIRTVTLLECPGWDGNNEHTPDSEDCHPTAQKVAGNGAEFRWLEPLPYLVKVSIEEHTKRLPADARGEEDVTVRLLPQDSGPRAGARERRGSRGVPALQGRSRCDRRRARPGPELGRPYRADGGVREQSFEVRVDPERTGADFRVVLPDGSPAAGVLAFFRYDFDSGMRVRIPCDDEGICHPAGVLADSERVGLFHPAAGLTLLAARDIRASGVAVLRPNGGRLEIRIEAGPEIFRDAAVHAIVRFDGIAVGTYLPGAFLSGEAWAFGPRPTPIWIEGLPAGPITVEIQATRFDDQRRPVGKTPADPFVVNLPSEPGGPATVNRGRGVRFSRGPAR